MAYEIIKRLRAKEENGLLLTLQNNVDVKRRANNKLHDVWKLSFDWKYCKSKQFIKQKLNYIPDKPCSGKWNLCGSPIEYIYSSAKYYLAREDDFYIVPDTADIDNT